MRPASLRPPADHHASLLAAEQRLQAAQLASETDVLEALLDDRLVYTGPDGALHTKQDELAVHHGRQSLSALDVEDLTAVVVGTTGVTLFLGTVSGMFDGEPFTARVRYTRIWVHRPTRGWQLLAAHVSPASPGTARADG